MRRIMTEWFGRRGNRRASIGPPLVARAEGVFQRFFELIGKLEKPHPGLEIKSEPKRRFRITRLDSDVERHP